MTSPFSYKVNDTPDMELISKIALKGVIGQSLKDALEDLSKEETENNNNNNNNNNNDKNNMSNSSLQDTQYQVILESFGRAVAQTTWKTTTANASSPTPPCAMITGRLDHYNRFQGQWRIVMDAGGTLASKTSSSSTTSSMRGKQRSRSQSRLRRHFFSHSTTCPKGQEEQTLTMGVQNTEREHDLEPALAGNNHDHPDTGDNDPDTTTEDFKENNTVVIADKVQILIFNDL